MPVLSIDRPFELESGAVLPALQIAYESWGRLSPARDNAVWVFHALTGDARADKWWAGLVGPGKVFDPRRDFIVCANMLGSCYGSTGPASINPETGKKWGPDFPLITIRDMVAAHRLLADALGIRRIHIGIGGSMGGQQLLEWAVAEPHRFEQIIPIATNARHSAWGIAFNEAQRMAIEAELARKDPSANAGQLGLRAARAIAMLSYRNYHTYRATQDEEQEKLGDYRASSYQRYQGDKLVRRFDVYSYLTLSKAMDAHHVGRGRGGVARALGRVRARTLAIGIDTDMLFPTEEQREIASLVPEGHYAEIHSLYGHDAFLLEFEPLERILGAFRSGAPFPLPSLTAPSLQVSSLPRPPIPGTEFF